MSLSIIIVNWNTLALLRKCLDSLKFEIRNLKLEIEVIVVDNGSTDGSQEIAKEFKVKLIENKENLGFAKAVNQGIKGSSSEVFLLLNSDTQVKSNALEKLIEFEMQVRPAVIGARMLNPDLTVQGSCFYFPTIKRAVSEFWLGGKNYFSKYAPVQSEPVGVEAVSGGAMAISRGVIDKVGLFDERFFMYFEDLDYCRRAGKAGIKVYYLPEAQIIHEHGASGKDLVDSKDQWKRLIPSSKIYFGWLKHFLVSFILWSGQKCLKRKKQ